MPNILFVIQIVISVCAAMFAYAFLMSLLKKELNTLWLRGESVFALAFSGIAFALYYTKLLDTTNYLAFISALMLLVGVFVYLGTTILHRIHMRNDTAPYTQHLKHFTFLLACAGFTALFFHISFQIASLAWG